jgi:hypothetical protein
MLGIRSHTKQGGMISLGLKDSLTLTLTLVKNTLTLTLTLMLGMISLGLKDREVIVTMSHVSVGE